MKVSRQLTKLQAKVEAILPMLEDFIESGEDGSVNELDVATEVDAAMHAGELFRDLLQLSADAAQRAEDAPKDTGD